MSVTCYDDGSHSNLVPCILEAQCHLKQFRVKKERKILVLVFISAVKKDGAVSIYTQRLIAHVSMTDGFVSRAGEDIDQYTVHKKISRFSNTTSTTLEMYYYYYYYYYSSFKYLNPCAHKNQYIFE